MGIKKNITRFIFGFLFLAVVPGLYYLTAAHPDYEDQRNLPVTVDDLGQVKTVLLGNPDDRAERGNAVVEIYDQKLKFNILPYIRILDDTALTYKIHQNKLHVSGLVYNKTYSIQVLGELIGGISYDTVLSLKISPVKTKKVGTSVATTKEADLLSASGQKDFFLSGAFLKKLYLKESPAMHYPGGREMLTGSVLIVNESGNLLAEYLNRQNLSEPQLEKSLFGLAEMHKDGAGFGVYQVNICAKGANPDICDIKSGYTAFYHFEIIQGKLDASYDFLGNKKYFSSKAQEGNAVNEVLRLEMYGLGVGLANKTTPTFWKAPTLSTFSESLKRKNISYKDKNLYISFYEKKITAGSSLNESVKIEFCNSCNSKGKNLFYHYDLGLVKNNSDSVLKMNLRFKVDKQLSYSLKFECAQNNVCSFRDVQNQFLESLGYKDEVTYRRDLRANTSLISFLGNFLEFVTCDLEKDYDCALNASGGAMVEVALLGIGKVYSVGKRLVVVGRPGQIGKNTKISPEDARRLEELIRGAGALASAGDDLLKEFSVLVKKSEPVQKLIAKAEKGLLLKKIPTDQKLWDLSEKTGVEWVVYEFKNFKVIRSGTRTSVQIPKDGSIKSFTHTHITDSFPSLQDYYYLLDIRNMGSKVNGIRIIKDGQIMNYSLPQMEDMKAKGLLKLAK